MTFKEARVRFESFGAFCDDRNDACDDDCDKCKKMENYIIETLWEAEKYRWHDLRKNPEDLPRLNQEEEIKCCLCEFKNPFGMIYYEVVSYVYFDSIEGYDWAGLSWRSKESLIAWKEIDPFEKEK